MEPRVDEGTSDADVRRFTRAAVIGVLLTIPPYLTVLWGGRLDPLRSYYADRSFGNFFDLQARALFHGHWYLPDGSIGIEGFAIRGRTYTYFGPFPALLRMPLLAVTSRFDGRLTAPSMLVAWLVTGLCVSLLLWRIRHILRGEAPLGNAEATAYGALIAAVLGGSVLLYLGNMPAVYNEDLAWGVATTVAALFAVLGVLEQPTRRRVLATGVFILAATLSRTPLGWACVIGALITSGWFALGYGGRDNQGWWRPVLAAGLLPLFAGMYVTWAKFGTPVGLPMASQVWAQIDQHRRDFLAANGGKAFSVGFLPTTLLAYLRPDGIRLTPVFPFVTLPSGPPRIIAGAVFDQTYRTSSVAASMPLLFLLSLWGLCTAARPLPTRLSRAIRIVILTAGAGTAGVLVWGYIANRYLTDFMPLLAVASAVGLIDLFRRIEHRARPRAWLASGVVILAALGIFANVAVSSTPTDSIAWQGVRVQEYVRRQEAISRHTGNPISGNVVRVTALPSWAPADRLYVLDQCTALYISDGERYHTWIPVDFGPGLRHTFDVTLNGPTAQTVTTTLVQVGHNLVSSVNVDQLGGQVRITFDDPLFKTIGAWIPLTSGRSYPVTVDTDTQLHTVVVSLAGQPVIDSLLSTGEPEVSAPPRPPETASPTTLRISAEAVPQPALCRALR